MGKVGTTVGVALFSAGLVAFGARTAIEPDPSKLDRSVAEILGQETYESLEPDAQFEAANADPRNCGEIPKSAGYVAVTSACQELADLQRQEDIANALVPASIGLAIAGSGTLIATKETY